MHGPASSRTGSNDPRRWSAAAALALALESVIVAAVLWWARSTTTPPLPPVVAIVLEAPRPARQTVAPPQPRPSPPVLQPVEKPRPRPVAHKRLHRAPPEPLVPPRMLPQPRVAPASAPIAETQPLIPVSPPARELASVRASFEAALRSAIQAAVRYPVAAGLMRLTGSTVVAFQYRDGRISAVRVARSCGIGMLDHAAVQAVRDAPYPTTPAELQGQRMAFQIRVRFRLPNP